MMQRRRARVWTGAGMMWKCRSLQPFSVGEPIDNDWPRFDAGGVYEGVVVMPSGFRPTAVRGAVMLGVFRDSSNVECVRAYRVVDES